MVDGATEPLTVADVYLRLLAQRGVDVLFHNAGTDFPPVVEAYARAQAEGAAVPRGILVPHENVAVAMAHGYYLRTGKVAAVMVHVGLGTANALNGLNNASRQRIPLLLIAGRTPWTEQGPLGTRDNYIHWAQEMFDQGGMVREFVKWDFELRHPDQIESLVDRAIAVTMSAPAGPVYLTLPREVLAQEAVPLRRPDRTSQAVRASGAPQPADIERVAALWRKAERPLVVTSSVGESRGAAAALAELAEATATPVVHYRLRYAGLPTDHPFHAGWDPAPFLKDADLVVVADSDVPWIPAQVSPPASCPIVQIAPDPLFERYPYRGFAADIALASDMETTLRALAAALGGLEGPAVEARRESARATKERQAETLAGRLAAAGAEAAIQPVYLSKCIADVCDEKTILFNEYPLDLTAIPHDAAGRYYSHSPAGGLGWALGAALGAKLGEPDATVIAAVGDGAYMFGNPVPAHYAAKLADLPMLTIVANNAMWLAVHRATVGMYPDGHASRANTPPLSMLDPDAAFEHAIAVSGGWGERVSEPAALPDALRRALNVVREEKRGALLNVIVQPVLARAG